MDPLLYFVANNYLRLCLSFITIKINLGIEDNLLILNGSFTTLNNHSIPKFIIHLGARLTLPI